MNKKYLGLLLTVLIISLLLGTLKKNTMEGLVNLDRQYLDIEPQPQDVIGNYYLPPGYYAVGINKMAVIPTPQYKLNPNKTGIMLDINDAKDNATAILEIKKDSDGNYTIPNGYYSLGNNQMAIIPYGFNTIPNDIGISLNPLINTINAPIAQNSPTSNLTDKNASSLIKYNSNNFNTKYHDDISLNDSLGGLQPGSLFYQPGTFKYGGSTYVPTYEDSVYLSKSTLLPSFTVLNKQNTQTDICEQYKYQPNKLENACNNLDNNACKMTGCCVSLGGTKCVAGNEQGPTMKYNYSNYLVKDRDYYFYKNKCYGNCPYYDTGIN